MSESFEDQVRSLADPIIATGGSPDLINVVLRRKLGIEIGRGGAGPDIRVPPCSYCGAYGGGGHGGFCPGPEGAAVSGPEVITPGDGDTGLSKAVMAVRQYLINHGCTLPMDEIYGALEAAESVWPHYPAEIIPEQERKE